MTVFFFRCRAKKTCFALLLASLFLLSCSVLYTWRALQLHFPQRSFRTEGVRTTEAPAVVKEHTMASVDTSDSSLERLLPAAFKAALERYPVVPAADVKIVVIVAYYRSGSSFVGELLSSAPRTFFHFEPLIPFTVSGSIRQGRQSHAFRLIDELVRCCFEPLYTVWLENTPYYKFNHFLADLCEGGESCSSPSHLSALCSRAGTQVFKFTRLRVSQVGSWIERNPDIAQSVRVVHLVRDPRAIYSSRRGLRWCTNYKPCGSVAALCDQMRSDLDAFGELTRRLQINRTYQIRFEDLAANPLNETMRVFGRLGLNYAPSVSKYIETHTAAAAAAEMRNAHSTKRNSKAVVHMWKQKLSMQTIREIETTCGDVLHRLGYKRVPK
ncbi:carbohydrate sulfotransferase 4-like isoform X2 [Dermacentor andersoni]|uniref:carbohydrate sulfotransferase 4-like isoform X2 n=1 Tax=Dermacentor andersoni TaxID=34620 RepID=UPI0024167222|nr:carbohydrate sulfotransferase 4-like isoform X2 [Dermacentor andersoni]